MNDLRLPIIGLDIGQKKTGVSLSESGIVVRALPALKHGDQSTEIARKILALLEEIGCQNVVYGIPLSTDGTPSEQAAFVESVINQIQELDSSITFHPEDERGTTKDAGKLFKDIDDDTGAAILILQDWLENNV